MVCYFQTPTSDISFSVIFPFSLLIPSHTCPRHYFFCFVVLLPNQSFSFCPELILPSLIIDAILQTSLTTSSKPILLFFLLLYHVFYLPRSAFHCDSLQMALLCSVLLLGNLGRSVERCLDWMWLALLSTLQSWCHA